jgi:hypothetical protein
MPVFMPARKKPTSSQLPEPMACSKRTRATSADEGRSWATNKGWWGTGERQAWSGESKLCRARASLCWLVLGNTALPPSISTSHVDVRAWGGPCGAFERLELPSVSSGGAERDGGPREPLAGSRSGASEALCARDGGALERPRANMAHRIDTHIQCVARCIAVGQDGLTLHCLQHHSAGTPRVGPRLSAR